ncbi:hypothetical protein [Pseudomonas citronellolis]|uniref:hypothetical protein n=1 Tax=Pseudomonas citronellolis TaxID=53408 RepID=UPI0020A096DA|nr:hypothetical protein [Pseudomonas citronellolis]MCP1606467.1 hypothetical protein [Pseudomonas citronellolis]MCP1657173.1 hypothetical protein [Pseudomonas citronellolis]MCP1724094.1 hypothetical protein [Pseudomonas citronellolis]
MAYPNSPVDAVPAVWGWPWHGLMTSEDGESPKLVYPDTGRVVDCGYGGHWTFLWDIGMPEPVLPEGTVLEPNEAWWTKAVLRHPGGAEFNVWGWAGTGAPGPIRLASGVGKLELQCWLDFFTMALNVRATVTIRLPDGIRTSTAQASISRADLGMPASVTEPPLIKMIDRRADGCGVIIRLYQSVGTAARPLEETLGLVEAQFSGDFNSLAVSLQVLATAAEGRGAWTIITDPGPFSLTKVQVSRPDFNTHDIYVGTVDAKYRLDQAVWAWYDTSGYSAEVVRYSMLYDFHAELTADITEEGNPEETPWTYDCLSVTDEVQTYTLSAGGVSTTSVVTNKFTEHDIGWFGAPGNAPTHGVDGHRESIGLWDGEQVGYSATNNYNEYAWLGFTIAWPWVPDDSQLPWTYQVNTYGAPAGSFISVVRWKVLSNKMLAIRHELVNELNKPGLRWTYTDALSPSGTVSGRMTMNSDDTYKPGKLRGSWCPVTFQAAKHLDLHDYSWV